MNTKTGETRGRFKIACRKDNAAMRIPLAFLILAIVILSVPMTRGGYLASDAKAPIGNHWRENQQQNPTGVSDRNPPSKITNNQSGERSSSEALITSLSDYRIGPNDVIEVRVEKAPEISGMFRVNSTGTILLNYLGRILAQNKTPDELAQTIADGLRGDYIKQPHVEVEVKQYNSRAFFIQGAVRNPGLFHIEGSPSLMKLIIIAGGLADNHGSTAFIIREIKPEDAQTEASQTVNDSGTNAVTESKAKYELIKRNINGLLKGAFDQDLQIEPGDVVNVPSTEVFFVAGEVHAPGSFPLKDGTSLRQAISMAQGTTPNAALGRGIVFREDPVTGKRQEISVDISEVMKGKKEDIIIMPNDTVIVPHSRLKSMRNTLLYGFGYGFMRGGGIAGRF